MLFDLCVVGILRLLLLHQLKLLFVQILLKFFEIYVFLRVVELLLGDIESR